MSLHRVWNTVGIMNKRNIKYTTSWVIITPNSHGTAKIFAINKKILKNCTKLYIPGPKGDTNRSTIPNFLALSAFTVFPVRARSKVVGIDVRAGNLHQTIYKTPIQKNFMLNNSIVFIKFNPLNLYYISNNSVIHIIEVWLKWNIFKHKKIFDHDF